MWVRAIACLVVDLLLIAGATLAALLLRDNLEFSGDRLIALLPYLGATLGVAVIALLVIGTHRTIWRLSTMHDYIRLVVSLPLVVAAAVALGFAINRLDGVARAIPILQVLLMITLLVGVRVAAHVRHTLRDHPQQLVAEAPGANREIVLVLGLSRLTDAYLRTVTEFAPQRVYIAGVLGRYGRHIGRSIGQTPILGTPEQLETVLRDLGTHGVTVDRIVVTTSLDRLSPEACLQLRDVEQTSAIKISWITELMGLEEPIRSTTSGGSGYAPGGELAFAFEVSQLQTLARRRYWKTKRALDVIAATVLLIVTAPIYIVCACMVAIDLGLPVQFWQARPGLGGRPFKLFKLRTMRSQHDGSGEMLDEVARISRFGGMLRRSRLDELPQLFNILIGDMSFVGPRPLLPADQSPAFASRLLVRPGLTGWAQVTGGRVISAEDKAALDVWYVQNASLRLDIEICLRTVPMVLFGERISRTAIQQAWRDLRNAGICRQAIDTDEGMVTTVGHKAV